MPLTAAEFEAEYARRSNVTVKTLHWLGRFAEPCDCGEEICEGWALGYQQLNAIDEDALRSAAFPPRPGDGEGEQGAADERAE